jgi:MtN3 and saliva related transmembrane protein
MPEKPGARRIVPKVTGTAALLVQERSPPARVVAGALSADDFAAERRRMQFLETVIGVIAAMLTSLSYIPQVKKVRAGQSTEDLSSRTLIALTAGLLLWVVYGSIKADWIIIAANIAGTCLTAYVLYHKLQERQETGKASARRG